MATYKKTSIEGAQEKVLFEEVLKQKKKELGDAYEEYKQKTTQQELLKKTTRKNSSTIPDPKKHQTFIRRTRRDYTRPIVWGIIGLITIILIVKVLQIITQ